MIQYQKSWNDLYKMNKSSIKCHHYRTVQRHNAKPNFKWRNVNYIDWTVVSYMVDVWGALWCCAGATCSLLLGFRWQMFLHNFSLPDCSPIAFVSAHHSSYGKYFFFHRFVQCAGGRWLLFTGFSWIPHILISDSWPHNLLSTAPQAHPLLMRVITNFCNILANLNF